MTASIPTLTFRIGGFDLCVTGAKAIALLREAPDFETFRTSEAQQPFLLFQSSDSFSIPQANALYDFSFDSIECRFGRTQPTEQHTEAEKPSGYFLTMTSPHGDVFNLRFQPGNPLIEASLPSHATMLRFGLWTAYGLAGVFQKAIPIHASTIVWQGKAILFLGESGTGKSTHTRLWQEYIPGSSLLNDDSPILRIEEGVPYVYGSPWSGKTACFRNERFPLAAVVRLCQAPHNRISLLPIVHAFGALYPSCPPAFARDPLLSDRICTILSDTIRNVRTYRLECLPNRQAAEAAFSAIFGPQ